MMLPPRSLIIGTAGHIDHGKTMLVRALTGIDTDRLPEEKRRGITIDLGFASTEVQAHDGMPLRISFVDVPGHALFIRNMLAGAGCVDAVMLVISAEEGIKPQTEEHLAICSLLGISRGLVVLSKVDAVAPERLEAVQGSVRSLLAGSFLADASILAASARDGTGLDEIRREILRIEATRDAQKNDRLLRMPIDRAFVMKGFGTVMTGALLSGRMRLEQALSIEPGHHCARIRGLQVSGVAQTSAIGGTRVAANLAGVSVSEVGRGQTLVEPGTLAAVDLVDAEVDMLPGASALKHRARLHLHAFTSDTVARVLLYEAAAVEPRASGLARLRLSQPVVLLPGDRFVLRQASPAATVGGGRILDAHPLPHARKSQTVAWLKALLRAGAAEQAMMRIDRRDIDGMTPEALAWETGLTPGALHRLLQRGIEEGTLLRVPPDCLLSRGSVEAAIERIVALLAEADGQATRSAIKRGELAGELRCSPAVLGFLLEHAARKHKLKLDGDLVWSAAAEPEQTSEDQRRLAAIAAIYKAGGLAPPLTSEVAAAAGLSETDIRKHLIELLREGTIVRLGSDALLVDAEALAALKLRIRALSSQTLDVARFKEMTGLTRKYAIPLLEYLDRERVTRKHGAARLVVGPAR